MPMRDEWIRSVADELIRLGCDLHDATSEAEIIWNALTNGGAGPDAALNKDPLAVAQRSAIDLALPGASQD